MISANYDYFLKIVEYRSISKAAESLYISQPSLTKYLKRLEATVGAPLFDRKQSPLRLTTAGEYLLEYVISVQEQEQKLSARIYEIQNQGRDRITIGMPLWRSSVLLPEFLPQFYRRHPLIQVRLVEGPAVSLEEAIRTDEIDFGIMNLPVNYADVSYEVLAEEYILLVASKDMPGVETLQSQTQDGDYIHADIQSIQNQPFILTQPGQHITDYVNQLQSRRNISLPCAFRTGNVATAINLAASGLGYTFVPELGTRSQAFPRDRTVLFTVDEPPLQCTLAAVWKKSNYLSVASRLFLDEFKLFCSGKS